MERNVGLTLGLLLNLLFRTNNGDRAAGSLYSLVRDRSNEYPPAPFSLELSLIVMSPALAQY